MKNSNLKINFKISKKISSQNIIFLIIFNVIFPFLAVLLGVVIDNLQGEASGYNYKTILITMAIFAFITLIVDVIFWLTPLKRLEKMIVVFRKSDDKIALEEYYDNSKSALELTFFELLKEQEISIEKIYKSEILRQQSELIALQSQMSPHFLYNTFDSIRGLALTYGVTEIADMTEAFSRLFRCMVSKQGKLITLEEELETVRNYMIIQRFRFNNRFSYSENFPDKNILNFKVPNLFLQPIVENCIVHGLEMKNGNGKIKISAYCTEKRLVISVEDDGVGINVEKLRKINKMLKNGIQNEDQGEIKNRTGIALTNINQRIHLTFGKDYGMNIMSTENTSTVIEMVLPIIKGELHD